MKIYVALILALATTISLLSTDAVAQASKPNIVVILADNLGYGESGPMGAA